MMQAIDHCGELIQGSKQFAATFSGDTIRLVVLPEYFMTGFPMGEGALCHGRKRPASLKVALEYEALGKGGQ